MSTLEQLENLVIDLRAACREVGGQACEDARAASDALRRVYRMADWQREEGAMLELHFLRTVDDGCDQADDDEITRMLDIVFGEVA